MNDRISTLHDANVERASLLDTATLSDALDRHDLVGQCQLIMPRSHDFRMTGRAWTLAYGPAGSPPGTVGDYIDDVKPGEVVVLANHGRLDVTVWGDILTEVAHAKGIAGTLIDGISRDVALCLTLGYPVFSRAHWMRTGKDRVQVEATQIPVSIGNVRVCPGDLIRGDADGVIVIPRAFEERVLDSAEQVQTAENAIRDAVRSGMSLREARVKHGYHALQSKAKS